MSNHRDKAADLTPYALVMAVRALKPAAWHPYVVGNRKSVRVETADPDARVLELTKRIRPGRGKRATHTRCMVTAETTALVAAALSSGEPVHLDRVLNAGNNHRSALEAVLAAIPEIHVVRLPSPGGNGRTSKHLVWLPESPHRRGTMNVLTKDVAEQLARKEFAAVQPVVRPVPATTAFETLSLHRQRQAKLVMAAARLGLQAYLPPSDRGYVLRSGVLGKRFPTVSDLSTIEALSEPEARAYSAEIDVIWVKAKGRMVPAAFEIEDSTNIWSGLGRMNGLRVARRAPWVKYWIIVAEERRLPELARKAARRDYRPLKIRFMSYESLDRFLAWLEMTGSGKPKGISFECIENFLIDPLKL